MKSFLKYAVLAATTVAAVAILAVPKAFAGSIDGTFAGPVTISVFTGSGVTDMANAVSTPDRPSDATFTYSGPISFNDTSGQGSLNTFADFFNSYNGTTDTTNYSSGISGFSSASGLFANENAFLAATMSTPGEVDNSFFEINGTFSAGDGYSVIVGHDDGASFYTLAGTSFTSPNPTSFIQSTGSLPPGSGPFLLDYVESNGAPAQLDMSIVPEPSSIALLGTGMLGLVGLMYTRLGVNS